MFAKAMSIIAITLFSGISFASAAKPVELLGVVYDAKGVTFQVREGAGCSGNHKSLYSVTIAESHPAQVSLVQVGNEPCEIGFPMGVKITYTYKELGMGNGSQFFITNPVRPDLIFVLFQ